MKRKTYGLALIVLFFDQLVKIIVSKNIIMDSIKPVINDFFFLTYTKNTGGAWSIFDNNPFLLIFIGFIFLGIAIYYIEKQKEFNNYQIIYTGFILGGIIGNLSDRIIQNGVIDFLGFQFGNYVFPIFNIADIFIVVGVMLILLEDIIKGGIKNDSRRRD